MIYLTLFLEFVKIGLFSIGGGLATLPYLYELAAKYPWFTETELLDMIAVGQSTPGAMGVNIAVFAGFKAGGILGGIVAAMGIVFPAIVVITLVAKVLEKFRSSKVVDSAFYGIRPAVTAMILVSAWGVIKQTILNLENTTIIEMINLPAMVMFGIFVYCMLKFKTHPIVYIGLAAFIGIFIPF